MWRTAIITHRLWQNALLSAIFSRPPERDWRPLPTQQGGPSSQRELELHLHRWKLTVTSFDPQLQTNTVAAAAQRAAPRPFDQGRVCFHLPLLGLCLLPLPSAGEEVSQKQGVTGLWVKSHLACTHVQAAQPMKHATKLLPTSCTIITKHLSFTFWSTYTAGGVPHFLKILESLESTWKKT